ncbi:hypothetical protein [Hyphococcus luteus]|nr:hypothetical protein [Marinicaulis flavus]
MNKPYLNFLIWLASAFLIPGNAAAEWKTYEGIYIRGFENHSFRECGKDDAWWVDLTSEASAQFKSFLDSNDSEEMLRTETDELSKLPANGWSVGDRFFVHVEGFLHSKGEYGHMGLWNRQLTIRQFNSLRFPTESDLAQCD